MISGNLMLLISTYEQVFTLFPEKNLKSSYELKFTKYFGKQHLIFSSFAASFLALQFKMFSITGTGSGTCGCVWYGTYREQESRNHYDAAEINALRRTFCSTHWGRNDQLLERDWTIAIKRLSTIQHLPPPPPQQTHTQ